MPHIIKELENVYPTGSHELDGELYAHSFKDKFEHIASLIRQEVPKPNCTDVEYHVYDKRVEGGFGDRIARLRGELHCYEKVHGLLTYIKFTETVMVKDEDAMMVAFEHFLKNGYEGGMARNANGLYAGKRSYDLQKIKSFVDDEFSIVGIKEGRGGYVGCGIFVCKNKVSPHLMSCICKECTFDVKMRGPKERLMEFWSDHSTWKGKQLTVKYQYISAYGQPVFPVGERFKEDL